MSMLQKQKIDAIFRLRDECHEVQKLAAARLLKPLLVLVTCALASGSRRVRRTLRRALAWTFALDFCRCSECHSHQKTYGGNLVTIALDVATDRVDVRVSHRE